ncbi:MAG TPA: PQQ-binding-like beta-propeller repeat protein, partial [Tepidisphaeraceae bacterium]
GKLFVLPSDSDFLMVYDAQSGVALKQINLTDAGKQISRVDPNSDEDFDTFLGVWKDWFLVSGDQYVMAINWKTYTGNPNVGLAASPPNMKVRGRGFITSDAVYIPGEERLFKIELSNELERKGLRIVQTYPQSPAPWDDGEDPGNLLVMQDQVVVAGPNRVNVYTDLNVASGKLDKEIAAAPTAVEPRLRYAEVLFIAGQHRKSMEKLDDAVGLLGGMEGMKGGPQRDRIFSDSLNFANKLAADPANNDVELTNALFDRAGAAAKSFSQQVNYRVSRARFADAQKDYALEVKLYQEILLGDKDMRGVFVTLDPANAPEQAAKVAEDAIAAVIKKQGADPYEPFETAAAKALEEAKTANDPAKMLAVAEAYPNAKVAVTSMMAAADSYETQGNVRSALYVLQSVNRKFRASPERPKVIEALARNRLKRAEGAAVNTRIDALAIAGRQLAAAAREFPAATLQKPLILPGGQKLEGMPFAEAAAAVQKLSAEASTAVLPDFGLPAYHDTKQPAPFIPEDPASVIPNVAGMVAPLPGFARYDRIVAWSTTATLGVYEIGKSEPAVSSKALADAPLAHAWVYGELLAWSGKQIAMIDKSGGATWKQDLAALGALEVIGADDTEVVATDDDGDNDGQQVIVQGNRQLILRRGAVVRVMPLPPGGVAAAPVANGPEQIMHIRPIGDRVVGSTSNGRLFAINSADGKLAWQTRLTNRPIDTLLANDDFVVIKMADDYAVQIVVFDAYNGQLVSRRSFPLAQGIVPVNMAMSRDGMLVYTLPDRICGMDLYEGGNALKYQEPQQPPPGQFVYSNAVQSDQLVITDGRILALTEANQTVRILSLETGRELGNKLGTGVQPGTEGHLRAVGNRLYVIGLRTVLGFNVAKPEDHWDGWVPNKSAQDKKLLANIRDAAIGKDFLVVFDQTSVPNVVPGQPAPQQQTNWRLLAYSRSTSEAGSESGKFSYVVPITDPAGILQWQPVDRGFYYLTGDQKLHFLQGAAKKAENK